MSESEHLDQSEARAFGSQAHAHYLKFCLVSESTFIADNRKLGEA